MQRLLGIDEPRLERGHERVVDVVLPPKDVLIHAMKKRHGVLFGVHIDRRAHERIEAPDLVEAERVSDVVVRIDDRIAPLQPVSQRLLPKIGRGVDQNDALVLLTVGEPYARPATRSSIARIAGGADLAIAPDHRNPGGRAGAEDDELQLQITHWNGTEWETVPVSLLDIDNNKICGQVFGFSWFGLLTVPFDSDVGPSFRRGDCNTDGRVDISDVVSTLEWLFRDGEALGCVAAANTNGDDAVDIGDAVYSLWFSFGGGPAPVTPFPKCGTSNLVADQVLGCVTPPKNCL